MCKCVHFVAIALILFSIQLFPQNKVPSDPRNELIKLMPPHERIENPENQLPDSPSDYYRSTETYDDMWDGATWVPDERIVYTYDDKEGSTDEITQVWNGSDWENDYRYTYTFNDENYLYVYQYWNGTEWLNDYRYVYNYESGYLSNYLVQLGDSLSWENYYRYIYYRNNVTNLEDSVLSQLWNVSTWENDQFTEYTKNSNGRDSIIIYYNWSAGWENQSRYLYSYDNSTLSYEYSYQTWDGSNWVNSSHYSYSYDSNNNYLGYTSQTWDGSIWVNDTRYVYTYNGNNERIEYKRQDWDGAVWVNNFRYTYEYDSNGNRTKQLSQDYNMGTWENNYQFLYSFDENNLTTELRREDWDGTIFVNSSRTRYFYELVSSVGNESVINTFRLFNNYPNPFNPSTKIDFNLSERSNVTLIVYDILGKEVATLLNGEIESGIQTVSFDANNLASGIYFYKIDVHSSEGKQSFSETRKMLLMK